MTDTTASGTPAENTADDNKEGRTDAIHVLARALWRERLSLPGDAAETDGDEAKLDRADWKEKRKDYVKLATRLYKRMDRNGATISAPPAKDADEEGEAA